MSNSIDLFGSNVFNDSVMKERLPRNTYKELKRTMEQGEELSKAVAEVVANAMKDWAIEKGATHFTHWFQPMTGMSAGKHDAFINPMPDGRAIAEFSGKGLTKGESDASSFPSGGLRATFEARGYTAWDCTSPAFIKDNTLFIPTAFCSYTGEALDKKTPLLRSMEAINRQAVRVLRLLGDEKVKQVITTSGAEQEYFLIDKNEFLKRKDLRFTGRTLFGARSPKGQELDDHYMGSIKERVMNFMQELDMELWKLGVAAKTRHNEVAPSQYEIAPIYDTTNIAADHNQIIMETLKKIAVRHDFVCLLHEKPFKGINGSGKHNNWSLNTDYGKNLLYPTKNPENNLEFLLFLVAVIKAVDEYADLLRMSASNAGNDHRLGSSEAPPAIVSIFLGDHLQGILEAYEKRVKAESCSKNRLNVGVSTLPSLSQDRTDRNRTSPFAFTGNKFEFRMVPSSASISGSSYTLNTIVAESLSQFADRLENASEIREEVIEIIGETYACHKRIVFNGNNYSEEWIEEANRRGLTNISNTVDSLLALKDEKNIKVFGKHNVLSPVECQARYEIQIEAYIKSIRIEAYTMLDIGKRQIMPAGIGFQGSLAANINNMRNCQIHNIDKPAVKLLEKVSVLVEELDTALDCLEETLKSIGDKNGNTYGLACKYRDKVLTAMERVRKAADNLEKIVDEDYWPMPTYSDLFYETL